MTLLRRLAISLGCCTLLSCGGGGDESSKPSYPIGGTVTGLKGAGLTLRNNGGTDLGIAADGSFAFPGNVEQGAPYTVTISNQPTSPWQTCTVSDGAGTVGNAAVSNIHVECTTDTHRVSGSVVNLVGLKLAIQLNDGERINIEADGAFTFPTAIESGTDYAVTVAQQPIGPGQACSIDNSSGTIANADVTDVAIQCVVLPFSSIVLDIDVADMLWDSTTQQLYASVASPSGGSGPAIVVLDPRTGKILRTIPTTSIARPIVLSDDAQTLYTALADEGAIQRYGMPGFTANLRFNVGVNGNGDALSPTAVAIQPGHAETVAVTRSYPGPGFVVGHGAAIFDDGVARPDTIGGATPDGFVDTDGALWNGDGTVVYSFNVVNSSACMFDLAVSPTGLTMQHCTPYLITAGYGEGAPVNPTAYANLYKIGSRIYTASGALADPATRIQLGAFRTRGQSSAVDVRLNKAFFASFDPSTDTGLRFESGNLQRMTPIAKHDLPGTTGLLQKLVRWGEYGLAAATQDGKLALVTGTFVSEIAPVEIPATYDIPIEAERDVGAYHYRLLALPAQDFVWDESRGVLFTSVAGSDSAMGNSIAAIDVEQNHVTAAVAVNAEPRWLSQSDDRTRMFVVHEATSAVTRVNLNSMSRERDIPLNIDDSTPAFALAAEAQPGHPTTAAIIPRDPRVGTTSMRIVDDATFRPDRLNNDIGNVRWADATTLYGHNPFTSALDFYTLTATSTGLALVSDDMNLFGGGRDRIHYSQGLLYSDYGIAFDPVAKTVVADYNAPGVGAFSIFRVDAARDRAYRAYTDSGSTLAMSVHRLSTQQLLAHVVFDGVYQAPVSLASAGSHGIAIALSEGQLMIVQGPNL